MRKTIAAFVFALTLMVTTTSATFAAPSPPTNGGNGAGSSGNCTGPASERPTSCQSPGGVSGR